MFRVFASGRVSGTEETAAIYTQITKTTGSVPGTFAIGGHGIAVLKLMPAADIVPAVSSASSKDELSA